MKLISQDKSVLSATKLLLLRPSLGTVYISEKRRNMFISIYKMGQTTSDLKLLFKANLGYVGYTKYGRKKDRQGRDRIYDEAWYQLSKFKFGAIDIVYTESRLHYSFKSKFLRLLRTKSRLRYILFAKRQSHGFNRGNKPRRRKSRLRIRNGI